MLHCSAGKWYFRNGRESWINVCKIPAYYQVMEYANMPLKLMQFGYHRRFPVVAAAVQVI